VIVMGLLPLQEDVADYVRAGVRVRNEGCLFADFFATIRAVPRARRSATGADQQPFSQIAGMCLRTASEGDGCCSPH
jgi:hypothetical protein